ncbi:hypothetical protein DXB19_13110 [Lachnospiraceae bacterium OM02-26]|jgi:hypothetical protein|nr:hypothetical protein DXB19_13110 [Lachnospiraceae bacterium OM02-26]
MHMITLEIKDYCQECPEFDPEIRVIEKRYIGEKSKFDTTVQCRCAEKCERLYEFLKKEGGSD